MIGAIAGDIIGSRWEASGFKEKDFDLFEGSVRPTDDTVLTVAVADCLVSGREYAKTYQAYFRSYPRAGFGAWFTDWALARSTKSYGSLGNGAAMRVSPVGWAFESLAEVAAEARLSAEVTHDHPDAVRAAEATAVAVILARSNLTKNEIRSLLQTKFGYDLSRRLDEIRPSYTFDTSASGSVPEAIIAFLESHDWEDAVRNAISLGGDADTMACIAGAIAEAYYGVPESIVRRTRAFLDEPLLRVVDAFDERFGAAVIPNRNHQQTSLTTTPQSEHR
ncbi:MAG TPA: ADP-ribosylglycohydrolase family protein [Thermoanaerobaculia bacterium]|nr:ADP-ribosylglycohydrolase family protein [Thermoanaerobaculia bacterium]